MGVRAYLLDRYIASALIRCTFFVTLTFLGLFFFIGLVKESGLIGQHQYGIMPALLYVMAQMPSVLYHFFPMIMLLGTLMGLGHLAKSTELVMMRVSGLSLKRFFTGLLCTYLFLTAISLVLGELVSPPCLGWAQAYKAAAIQAGAETYPQWVRTDDTPPAFIHIGKVHDASHVVDVVHYRFRAFAQHQLVGFDYAKQATVENGRWVDYNGQRRDFLDALGAVMVPLAVAYPMSLSVVPMQYSLYGLYQRMHSLQDPLDASVLPVYAFMFWSRVCQPVLTMLLGYLVVPLVLGAPRAMSLGFRLFVGIGLGLFYYVVVALLGVFSTVHVINPVLAAVLPVAVFSCLGVVLYQFKYLKKG